MNMGLPERVAVAAAVGAATVVLYILHRRRSAAASAASAAPPPASNPAPKRPARECITLVPQTMCPALQLEYSVHKPSRLLRRDIELVFRPDLDTSYHTDPRGAAAGLDKEAYLEAYLLAVPTWQPSSHDLSEIAFEVNEERKGLLGNFDAWADSLRPRLVEHWSDVSCPMEGNARYGTPTSTIYNELEGLTSLLRYDSIPIGCCGIVLHPRWQRKAYPVTLFTLAPIEHLTGALEAVEAERAAAKGKHVVRQSLEYE